VKTAYFDSAQLVAREQGYSVIELLATISILVVVLAIALPRYRTERLQIVTAQRLIVANLRLARASAINESGHTQVALASANELGVAPMVENPLGSGLWQVDASRRRSVTLPTATQFASAAVGTVVEFNSRGFAVNLTGPVEIVTADKFGATRTLQVWPSGQVNEM